MRCLLQRVSEARVTVAGPAGPEVVGAIGPGLLALLGVGPGDDGAVAEHLAGRVAGLRIFESAGKMNASVVDTGGAVLVVSQFTLYADTSRGRRPSFVGAAPPAVAEPLYERFCTALEGLGVARVARGRFGAHMSVALVNDGPVTILLESPVPG